jgi:hypothetical protein
MRRNTENSTIKRAVIGVLISILLLIQALQPSAVGAADASRLGAICSRDVEADPAGNGSQSRVPREHHHSDLCCILSHCEGCRPGAAVVSSLLEFPEPIRSPICDGAVITAMAPWSAACGAARGPPAA